MDLKEKLKEKKDLRFLQEIKVRLSGVYSNSKSVFFFENTDDIETYNIWIKNIRSQIDYHPFPMKGKDKCLKLYEYFKNQDDYKKSYFFIDHDFDGSKGYEIRSNLFITDRYSIENYLFDPEIIVSYLQAEFKCYEPNNLELLKDLKKNYETNLTDFLSILKDLNYQIFLARSLNIDVQISDIKKLKDHIVIDIDKCTLKPNSDLSDMLDENIHEISNSRFDSKLLSEYHAKFQELNMIKSYRGKFIHLFFKEWLGKLKELHNSSNSEVKYFTSGKAKFDPNTIDLYKYANYSSAPIGLDSFLSQVA